METEKRNSRKINEDVRGNPLPCELYMDGFLLQNIKNMHTFVIKDWDNVGFIVGYEGDGKSVFGHQLALALDASFCLDRIVFTAKQLEEAVDNAKKGQCIVWDEADDLSSRWYEDMLKALKKKLKRIRSLNLHIIFITPTFFDINKYFAISRARWLINVYANGFERGFFRFFGRDKKKRLYLKGKDDWNMRAVAPNFIGRFTNYPEGFPINREEYNDKKYKTQTDILEQHTLKGQRISTTEVKEKVYLSIIPCFFIAHYKHGGKPLKFMQVVDYFGVSAKRLREIFNIFRDNPKNQAFIEKFGSSFPRRLKEEQKEKLKAELKNINIGDTDGEI